MARLKQYSLWRRALKFWGLGTEPGSGAGKAFQDAEAKAQQHDAHGNWAAASVSWWNAAVAAQQAAVSSWAISFALLKCGGAAWLAQDRDRASSMLLLSYTLEPRIRKTREFYLLASRVFAADHPAQARALLEQGCRLFPDDHALAFEAGSSFRDGRLPSLSRDAAEILALRLIDLGREDRPSLLLAADLLHHAGAHGTARELVRSLS